jgi:molecular chaperone DnaK (HSP70)
MGVRQTLKSNHHPPARRPFLVKAGADDKPVIEVQYKNEAQTFTPEEISSMILMKMKVGASTSRRSRSDLVSPPEERETEERERERR